MISIVVSVVILVLAALCVLVGVLRARKKPTSVAISRLILTLIAVPVAVLITHFIAISAAGGAIRVIRGLDVIPAYLFAVELVGFIQIFCAAIIASGLFLLLFPIINALLRIPVKPLSRFLDNKILHRDKTAKTTDAVDEKTENPGESTTEIAEIADKPDTITAESVINAGNPPADGKKSPVRFILGGLCGLIFAVAMLSPIVGTLRVIGDALSLPAALADGTAGGDILDDVADGTDALPVKAVGYIGGDLIYKGLSTYKSGGIRMSITKEMTLFSDLADYLRDPAADKGPFSEYSKAPKESVLIGYILPDALTVLFDSWSVGQSYLGLEAPSFDGTTGQILNGGLQEFSELDRDQMRSSMISLTDLAAYILDYGGTDGLESLFSDEEMLTNIYACLIVSEPLHNALKSALNEALQTMMSRWSGSGIVLAGIMPTDAASVADEARGLAHATVAIINFNANFSLEGDSLEETLYNLGAILDGFKDTDMIGEEQTKELLESALHSESIKEALGYDTARAEQEIENILGQLEEENYAALLSSLAEQVKR